MSNSARIAGPSPRLIEAEVIDPQALSPVAREALLRRLYTVHQAIFAGVSEEEFAHYLCRPEAVRTRIQVYRNAQGELVGYCAVHIFEIQRGNRTFGILRAEAGLLADYRGTSTTLWFGAKEAFRYKALHPFRRFALFAMPVHPSSFHLLSQYFWRSYPHRGRHFPKRWLTLLLDLASWSGNEAVDPSHPLVRRVGWVTKESGADVALWRMSQDPDVQFYLSMNPTYGRGHGLAFIAPLSAGNLFVTLIKYLWHFVVLWLPWQRERLIK